MSVRSSIITKDVDTYGATFDILEANMARLTWPVHYNRYLLTIV